MFIKKSNIKYYPRKKNRLSDLILKLLLYTGGSILYGKSGRLVAAVESLPLLWYKLYTCSNKPNIIVLFCSDAFSVVWIYQERLVCWGIYIYKVVISVCLFVCLSDHNSGTPGPIVLKF